VPRWGVVLLVAGALLVVVGMGMWILGSGGGSTHHAKVGPLKPFSAADARFRASFPTPPRRTEQNIPAEGAPIHLVQYTSEVDTDTGYSVGWFRLAQAPVPTAVHAFLEATEQGSVDAINGKLVTSQYLTVGGHPAVDYLASIHRDQFVRSRTVLVGRDVYVLQVVSAEREAPRFRQFIDSFTPAAA
jgi:hypothetical protein